MSKSKKFRKTIPLLSIVLFLMGVFFIFSTIGFVSDISGMGRQPALRFVLTVLLSGVFPIFYAVSGMLRAAGSGRRVSRFSPCTLR